MFFRHVVTQKREHRKMERIRPTRVDPPAVTKDRKLRLSPLRSDLVGDPLHQRRFFLLYFLETNNAKKEEEKKDS